MVHFAHRERLTTSLLNLNFSFPFPVAPCDDTMRGWKANLRENVTVASNTSILRNLNQVNSGKCTRVYAP